jgi:hypothetical protein
MDAGPTGRRRALLWLLLAGAGAALAAALLEASALAHFAWTRGGLYYTAQAPPPARDPGEGDARARALHPYFGFAVRPGEAVFDLRPSRFVGGADSSVPPAWAERRANNFGFYSEPDYPVHDDGAWLVGVFGGSLAHSLALQSGALLEQRLAALPALRGRRVRVLNFASGGYKQPQQLLILAYFLALGQRFDLVVNLDGFNEASLGSLNVASGLDTSMPTIQALRALAVLASGSSDPEAMRFLLALEDLRARREALERARVEAPLALLHLVADVRLARLEAERRALAERPPDAPARSLLWLAPPLADPAGGADPGPKLVAEWRRASEAMAGLAARAGARYLHVLQPNQHVGAHPFSDEERRLALNPASPYAPPARALYPLLRGAGAGLRAAGVDFHDATALFDAVPDVVYSDDCCHLNQRGYDRLAELIGERVGAQLAAPAPAGAEGAGR